MKALVLDDEPRYREHLRRTLRRQGLDIHVAGDPEEARGIVEELGIDLMIVDIKLSSSIDGLDFADWAKQQQQREPALIVITGYGSDEHEQRSRRLGALAYLEKPFDLKELERHVQHAINRHNLLGEIHRLEQELAGAKQGDFAQWATCGMPVACIRSDGQVLYASPEGGTVVDALVSPQTPRPAVAVDEDLMRCLRQASPTELGWSRTTLFRRDGVVGHYEAFVRSMELQGESGYVVFFHDEPSARSFAVDDLWVGLLLRAARKSGAARSSADR